MLLSLLLCVLISTFRVSYGCLDGERIALLDIRASLLGTTTAGKLASWLKSDDCCTWEGVVCDNSTRRITHLYLSSLINGSQAQRPCQMGLNSDVFSAFHELQLLDFSMNYATFQNWDGLVGLTKLRYLKLNNNCLNSSIPASLGKLVYMEVLHLQFTGVGGVLPTSVFESLRNLRELDLSSNQLNGSIPSSLFSLPCLEHLSLSLNLFEGSIPVNSSSNLTSAFKTLNFSMNKLSGEFSFFWLKNLTKLKTIDVSGNANLDVVVNSPLWSPSFQLKELVLSGCDLDRSIITKPQFLITQHQLEVLDLSNNSLSGNMPNWLFTEQATLVYLNLGNNSLTGSLGPIWYPQINLQAISLSMDRISGHIPANISSVFPNMSFLDVSSNAIIGEIPLSLCNISSIQYVDLSKNNLSGELPSCMLTDYPILKTLKVSKNKLGGPIFGGKNHLSIKWELCLDGNEFEGTLPLYLTSHFDANGTLDLHDNKLSGKLDFSQWNLSTLCTLSLAGNRLTGEIHPSICNLTRIMLLELSNNNLSGVVPNCTTALKVDFLSISHNSLSGQIPPFSFFNSSIVMGLDLGHNRFTGNIEWVQYLGKIKFLSLGSNNFEGQIPPSLCQLQSLRILDLSNNNLSGSLPPCIGNLSFEHSPFATSFWSLICEHRFRYPIFNYIGCYGQRGFSFRTKGNIYIYKRNFINLMSGIDLSANMLSGQIPWELGNLENIKALNMSHNFFAGPIPPTFANLSSVESLDLSHNKLSGTILWQLTRLSSLSVFLVMYNNLSGCIPDSVQFGSFDMGSYQGNNLIYPTSEGKECAPRSGPGPSLPDDGDEKASDPILYKVTVASFVVTFWISFAFSLRSLVARQVC
uniref:non-specific serine/threonine protein kinase n=1 Tax=Leersia perrieri TaxID=77586 RepID=A0A0D9X7T4_9ORYZ